MSPTIDSDAGGQRLLALAPVEDRDLVAVLEGEFDAGQRDLAGAADEKDVHVFLPGLGPEVSGVGRAPQAP